MTISRYFDLQLQDNLLVRKAALYNRKKKEQKKKKKGKKYTHPFFKSRHLKCNLETKDFQHLLKERKKERKKEINK